MSSQSSNILRQTETTCGNQKRESLVVWDHRQVNGTESSIVPAANPQRWKDMHERNHNSTVLGMNDAEGLKWDTNQTGQTQLLNPVYAHRNNSHTDMQTAQTPSNIWQH